MAATTGRAPTRLPSETRSCLSVAPSLHAPTQLCLPPHRGHRSCTATGQQWQAVSTGRRPLAVAMASIGEAAEAAAAAVQAVEFVLVRECSFGQSFFVVGSTPGLGCWDLDKALPLEWSEGHVWRGTLEVTEEELASVEFKFVMLGEAGEVLWQPLANHRLGDGTGPDIACEGRGGLILLHRPWEDEPLGLLPEALTAGTNLAEAAPPDPVVSQEPVLEGGFATVEVRESAREEESVGGERTVAGIAEHAGEGDLALEGAAAVDAVGNEAANGAAVGPSNGAARSQSKEEAANGAVKKRKPAPASTFARVVSKDAEWGKSVLSQLLGTWGRKPLMAEEEGKK